MNGSRWGSSPAVRALLLSAIGLGLFAGGVWVGRYWSASETLESPQEARVSPPLRPTPAPAPLDLSAVEVPPPFEEYEALGVEGARVAVVIDDLGRSVDDLDALGALGVPLTYSVLPFEVLTPAVVSEINRRGLELMCHLPMEPQSGANPGPGALTSEMTSAQLAEATRQALEAVPGAVGVNNHMGSSLSADPEAMLPIMEVVHDLDLFFLDSRTSAASVGYRVAVDKGVPATERQVFLDAVLEPESIDEQFDRLLWLARDRGEAVAIGHPHAMTIEVLSRRIPQAVEAGFEFVPVSYLLDRSAPLE